MGLKASSFSPLTTVGQDGGSIILDRMLKRAKLAMDQIAQGLLSNASEDGGIWTIQAGPAAPATNPPKGRFYLYIDPVDGKLKTRGSNGTVTVIGTP